MNAPTFKQQMDDLKAEFLNAEDRNQTDAQLGQAILDFILKANRLRHGTIQNKKDQVAVDMETLGSLMEPSALTHHHSVCEAVFRRIVPDPEQAIAYLAQAIQDESKAQSDRAKKLRKSRHDSITVLIKETVQDFPRASADEVLRVLERSEGFVVLERVAPDQIQDSHDGRPVIPCL